MPELIPWAHALYRFPPPLKPELCQGGLADLVWDQGCLYVEGMQRKQWCSPFLLGHRHVSFGVQRHKINRAS